MRRGARLLLGASMLGAWMIPAAGAGSSTPEPLAYAFRFASAIASDARDRALAQEAVVLDIAQRGDLDGAVRLAGRIEGWRRASVTADLAAMLGRAGRTTDARSLLAGAEELRRSVEGWQSTRVSAHIAHARAGLGDLEEARKIGQELVDQDARQYAGRAVAAVSSGLAARGDLSGAMAALDRLDAMNDLDVAWWRTLGYETLAADETLPRAGRLDALRAARASAEGIDGWKKAEALQRIAVRAGKLGREHEEREALAQAGAIAVSLADTMPIKAGLLSSLARAWAGTGHDARARELLRAAEVSVAATLVIDRPALYADVASSWDLLGAPAEARRLYDRAIASAAGLVNARPRALAMVGICRAMGRGARTLDDATRSRLDDLMSGLREPW